MILNRVYGIDLLRNRGCFVETTAQEPRSFEVIAEQIVDSLYIAFVQLHGLLECLPSFGCPNGRSEGARSLGAAAMCFAKPMIINRILRINLRSSFESIAGF